MTNTTKPQWVAEPSVLLGWLTFTVRMHWRPTASPLLTDWVGLLPSVGWRWFPTTRTSRISYFTDVALTERILHSSKSVLGKDLTIFLWLVSKPWSSCPSLSNNGISGAHYCVQFGENFNVWPIKMKTWSHTVTLLQCREHDSMMCSLWKEGATFRCLLLLLKQQRRLPPYLLLCPLSREKFSTGPDYFLSL